MAELFSEDWLEKERLAAVNDSLARKRRLAMAAPELALVAEAIWSPLAEALVRRQIWLWYHDGPGRTLHPPPTLTEHVRFSLHASDWLEAGTAAPARKRGHAHVSIYSRPANGQAIIDDIREEILSALPVGLQLRIEHLQLCVTDADYSPVWTHKNWSYQPVSVYWEAGANTAQCKASSDPRSGSLAH